MLFALNDRGGINTRREVIDHISSQRWIELIGEDLRPTATSVEARYRIDLAWARKDGELQGLINNFERDAWELNRDGHDLLDKWIALFRAGKIDLHHCEMLSTALKRRIDPDYKPSLSNRERNRSIAVHQFATW